MFMPSAFTTLIHIRRTATHAHTFASDSLMTPLWAEEAHALGLGPNLAILLYLGLLLAFRACLVIVRCRLVHRFSADSAAQSSACLCYTKILPMKAIESSDWGRCARSI